MTLRLTDKDLDLLLTFAEEVLRNMKDKGDHYEYVGSMNDIEHLRDRTQKIRLQYDSWRITEENKRG